MVLSRGGALLAGIGVARMLGREQFGQFAIVQSTCLMLHALVGTSIGLTATKYVAEFRLTDPARVVRILALIRKCSLLVAVLTSIGILVFARPLATALGGDVLTGPLRGSVLLLGLGLITSAQAGVLSGFEAFRSIALINGIVGVITVPTIIVGTLHGGVYGALLGSGIPFLVGCALNARAISKLAPALRNTTCEWRRELAVLGSFSVPAFLSSVLVAPVTWFSGVMLSSAQGFEELGGFNAANQWRTIVMFVPSALAGALLPVLSEMVGTRRRSEFNRLLRKNIVIAAGACTIIAVPVIALGPWIMAAYGKDFIADSSVLALLMGAAIISSTLNVLGIAMASLSKNWAGAALNGVWAIVLIGVASTLVESGAAGLAMAYLIAYGAHLATCSGYVLFIQRDGVEKNR